MGPFDGSHPWQWPFAPLDLALNCAEEIKAGIGVIGRDAVTRVHFRQESADLRLPNSSAARLGRGKSAIKQVCQELVGGRRRNRSRLPPSDGHVRVHPEIIDERRVLSGANEPGSGLFGHADEPMLSAPSWINQIVRLCDTSEAAPHAAGALKGRLLER